MVGSLKTGSLQAGSRESVAVILRTCRLVKSMIRRLRLHLFICVMKCQLSSSEVETTATDYFLRPIPVASYHLPRNESFITVLIISSRV